MSNMGLVVWTILVLCATAGCTHRQLRWNTVQQSQTLTEIYEQQVLDNLAMFVYDPNSLPFFAVPNAGASNVNDQGNVRGGLLWTKAASGLASGDLAVTGTRSMTESWTLVPISDPQKLALMRCAYQRAVAGCGVATVSTTCPNCNKLSETFYAGRNDAGVTAECLGGWCWFGFGCKDCVPGGGPCCKTGKHCDLHVWVLPGGQDELSKLTLTILDFALNNPPPKRTKEVTLFFRPDGSPGAPGESSRVERMVVPFETQIQVGAVRTQSEPLFERSELQFLPAEPAFIPGSGLLPFEQSLRFLTPQFSP